MYTLLHYMSHTIKKPDPSLAKSLYTIFFLPYNHKMKLTCRNDDVISNFLQHYFPLSAYFRAHESHISLANQNSTEVVIEYVIDLIISIRVSFACCIPK